MAAKLQCEICGGKLVGKPGGIFECDSCGTEYSTEWAKAKIQEIKGTVKVEGTVEVTGKVQIDGAVKVENGGPSAESLIKRGMMELEDLGKAKSLTEEQKSQKQREIKGYFDRALEIEPENGSAFWGLYLLRQGLSSTEEAVENAAVLETLRDPDGYLSRARSLSDPKLQQIIDDMESAWNEANQDSLLSREMKEYFMIRNGVLVRKKNTGAGTKLWKADIPEGVAEIGAFAFQSCKEMHSASIPSSVRIIAADAFGWCWKLKSLSLPDGLKKIGDSAFHFCSAISSLSIPNSVETIGDSAFSYCNLLSTVTLPEGLTKIGNSLFQSCGRLESAALPESVTEIGAMAYSYCESLRAVRIPGKVRKIGPGAFENCRSLRIALIPPSVTAIEEGAFAGCKDLVIRGLGATAAEKYAEAEGIRFERLSSAAELNVKETELVAAAEKAERERKEAAERAERERKEAAERAERERREAAEREKRERKAAAERAEKEREKAHQEELAKLRRRNAPASAMIAAGDFISIAVTADGKLLYAGGYKDDKVPGEGYVMVAAGKGYSLALQEDGRVGASGIEAIIGVRSGQTSVSGWGNLVSIACGKAHSLGLRRDGTVVAIGDNSEGQCEVESWRDIVAIAAGASSSFGLRKNGTVAAAGGRYRREELNWKNIVALCANINSDEPYGLRADGTVVRSRGGVVEGWTDIIAIAKGWLHLVGLKADGSVIAMGKDADGQCDVRGWRDVVAISAGWDQTIAVQADGTVLCTKFTGKRDYYKGQCDISGWKLFERIEDLTPIPERVAAVQGAKVQQLQQTIQEQRALYESLTGFFQAKKRKEAAFAHNRAVSELCRLMGTPIDTKQWIT